MSMGSQLDPEQSFQTIRIVHVVILISVIMYAGIVLMIGGRIDTGISDPKAFDLIKYIITGLGVATAPVSLLVRSLLLDPDKLVRKALASAQDKTPDSPDSDLAEKSLAQRYLYGHMVPIVLADSIAVYGLVIFFLTRDYVFSLGLMGVSFVTIVAMVPRKSVFDDMMAGLERAKQMGTTGYTS